MYDFSPTQDYNTDFPAVDALMASELAPPPDLELVECGIGRGRLGERTLHHGRPLVAGVDPNGVYLCEAERRCPGVQLYRAQWETIAPKMDLDRRGVIGNPRQLLAAEHASIALDHGARWVGILAVVGMIKSRSAEENGLIDASCLLLKNRPGFFDWLGRPTGGTGLADWAWFVWSLDEKQQRRFVVA